MKWMRQALHARHRTFLHALKACIWTCAVSKCTGNRCFCVCFLFKLLRMKVKGVNERNAWINEEVQAFWFNLACLFGERRISALPHLCDTNHNHSGASFALLSPFEIILIKLGSKEEARKEKKINYWDRCRQIQMRCMQTSDR